MQLDARSALAPLPAEREERILAAIRCIFEEHNVAAGRDRRTAGRTPFFGPVTVTVAGERCGIPTRLSAFARDVSFLGIGLIHALPLACGEVTVTVRTKSGESKSLRAQIVWCRYYGDGWYASGGRFVDVIQPGSPA
jgi:hypothetical protein